MYGQYCYPMNKTSVVCISNMISLYMNAMLIQMLDSGRNNKNCDYDKNVFCEMYI